MGINYITGTINTNAVGSFIQPIASAVNFSVDLNISAASATGAISVYAQNDNPTTSTFLGEPILSVNVVSGVFTGGWTKFTFGSNDVPPASNLNIVWTPSGTPTGSISIIGKQLLG